MTEVAKRIRATIQRNGPVSIAHFMEEALGGEPDGYYRQYDPLGANGDFITAPEISQIFGELIGLWLVDLWQQMGRPRPITLVELGPGRGTLMKDALRAAQVDAAFAPSVHVAFVEINRKLRETQRESTRDVGAASIGWFQSFEDCLLKGPVFVIGNEYLDALPIRQYVFSNAVWRERLVGLNGDGQFEFRLAEHALASAQFLNDEVSASEGDVIEVSEPRSQAVTALARGIRQQSGAALLIDYGRDELTKGNSFQAVIRHQFSDPLRQPGEQDLTSHVDFSAARRAASQSQVCVWPLVDQGEWLERLGGSLRLQRLANGIGGKRSDELSAAYNRLISKQGMGTLFKVLSFSYPEQLQPAGFQSP